MKSYTDLEQNKKLAEILPIESADMHYHYDSDFDELESIPSITEEDDHFVLFPKDVRCWSLAALLNVLPRTDIEKEIWSSDKYDYRVKAYIDDGYVGDWYDNPVDACYEMILKLHEQKLL
jgi:hypothetical protein